MNKSIGSVVVMLFLSVAMVAATHVDSSCPAGSYLAADGNPAAYAKSVALTGGSVSDSSNAVGVDDNQIATIGTGNPDPYLVLDMGAGTEVWDRVSLKDFLVYGDNSQETANIWVSNSASGPWTSAGSINSVGDVDVEIPAPYTSVRFIKISNPNSQSHVEVDAVRGYCITNPVQNNVPEFGVAAAGLVLIGAVVVVAAKRR